MNTTLAILDWFNSHKEDIWASLLTIYYGLEKAGGLRSIGAKILGPKQIPPAAAETKQETKIV